MADEKRATLDDVLNYEPEQYLKDEEIALIRAAFKNNPSLLRVLRKVLLPTLADPALPIESIGRDAYLQGRNWEQIPADEAKILMVARQDAIKFIAGGLIQLRVIANSKDETPGQRQERQRKDSSQ